MLKQTSVQATYNTLAAVVLGTYEFKVEKYLERKLFCGLEDVHLALLHFPEKSLIG